MPRQRVGDIEIYYEVHGAGPRTLVLIRGLGSNLLAWYAQIEVLSRHYKCVVFDNRGAGRTDKPDAPYSIKQMADDTAGLMDASGITRCTGAAGDLDGWNDRAGVRASSSGQAELPHPRMHAFRWRGRRPIAARNRRRGYGGLPLRPPQQQKQQLQAVFCDDTIERRPEVVEKHNRIRAQYPIPPFAFVRQLQAIGAFDASARLGQIRVPTMVIAGRDDRLVAPQNSKLIADRISGAKLVELPGGHLFMAEFPEEFNRAVIDFIDANP